MAELVDSPLARVSSGVVAAFTELRAQPGRFFGLCVLAMALMATYGIVRPPVRSLFLGVYSAKALPWVWFVVAFVTVVGAGIYARFASSRPIQTLFFVSATLIAVAFAGLRVALGAEVPHATFALMVLMEAYIVILVESFWSLANLLYELKSARFAYGFFCASGSVGALAAELLQGRLAATLGTRNIIWLAVPILVLTGWFCQRLHRHSDAVAPPSRKPVGYREGWRAVIRSRYLVPLLCIVACSQIVINMVDYQLSATLEVLFPDEDLRTGALGQVYAAINVAALVLQVATGPIVAAFGVTFVLLAVPGVVGLATGAFAMFPRLLTSATAMIAAKSFDYSVFRAAKEMLYLPLGFREKTIGKTFVDMNTYRAAKAGAAALLLLLIPQGSLAVTGAILLFIVLWIFSTVVLAPRYLEAREDREAGQLPEPR